MKATILLFLVLPVVVSALVDGDFVWDVVVWIIDFIIGLLFDDDEADDGSSDGGGILDPIVQAACDAAIAALGIGAFLCDCNASLDLTADLSCVTDGDICLLGEDLLCGSGILNGTLDIAGDADISTCLALDSGLPFPDEWDFDEYELCITAVSTNVVSLSFDSCEASVNGDACGCEICPSGVAFTLDCSDVNISPLGDLVPIAGPVLELCSLFDFTRSAEPKDLAYQRLDPN